MTNTLRMTTCILALTAGISLAQAQTTNQDHTVHHPDGTPAAGVTTTPPTAMPPPAEAPASRPGAPPMGAGAGPGGPGMGGMMNGMMGGGMGGMMGNMDQMMSMMRMMHPMMPQAGGPGRMQMMPTEHVEGRIAFLKAELGITEAQLPKWTAYADALRATAKTMRGAMMNGMAGGKPMAMPARMDAMVAMMTARLETLKSTTAAAKALYAVLTDAQKKLADELIMSPMGGM